MDKEWCGIVIERGSFVSSLPNMSKQTGLSVRSIRTAITRLKSTHELTCTTTHKYTKITVCNYDKYQIVEVQKRQSKRQSERQTDDTQTTCQRHANDTNIRNIEDKEVKNNNNSSTVVEECEDGASRSRKKKKYSAEETKLHSECRTIFEDAYLKLREEKYCWSAKEAGSLVGVLKQIRFFMPEEERDNFEKLKYNFKVFLDFIIKRGDAFTLKKFSLAYINGNFNEIYNFIKDNGQSVNANAANGSGYSANDLADVFSNLRSE